MNRSKLKYGVAAICLGATMPAWSQEIAQPVVEPQAAAIEEIVVTARGRNEGLQKSPAAITAFSAKQIDDARIKNVADFIAKTPNISITKSQSAGSSFITVRGITQVRNGESPVAVVVDGVQQITSKQFSSDLFDVQQIEVLRGPQGALYGRNAIGGAIVITSKPPADELEFNANLSAGNGEDYRVQAAVSGPLIEDKLMFRLAGSFHDFGGRFENVFLNRKVDWLKDRNIRGALKANLTDTLTAELRGSYNDTRGTSFNFLYQPVKYASPTSCFLDPANPFGGPAPDANRVSRRYCANNAGSNKRTIANISLRLQKSADWGTITNTLSWVNVEEFGKADQFPYTASRNLFGFADGAQTQFETFDSWQNEFRVASSNDNRFRWMVGAYYLYTNRYISTSTSQDNDLGIINLYRVPQFNNPINPTLTFLADENHNTAYAFFGNLAYDVTDALEVSAAFRYDHDRRHQLISPIANVGVPAGCTVANTDPCSRTANFSKSQPKFTVNYRPDSNLTLFANWGVGFRSGQFNQAGAAAAANLPGLTDLAKAESASTTEAGIKLRLLDGKMRINATGYHTNGKNPFNFIYVGSINAQILVSIDKTELYGGEVEVDFTPMEGLNLFGSYGYTHSEIKKYTLDPAAVGNWAPYIPRDSATLGLQYRLPVNDSFNLFTRGEMEHHGKQHWDAENTSARSAYQLYNVRAGFETADGKWSLTAYVNNLTNTNYNAEWASGGFAFPGQLRSYGVELQARF
ncbi:TonB-dependent receptor [Sphingomonas sp. SRS2]|uniref:TonB-dependent receptor n=1 Tax=Sphingomonas sp. SRS2 TaxID=133190 RepID=UPI000618442E|nr:TonB-dependent receptor [Sphingomonas sp. SRS2]KKC24179.1 TonB-dependent receptor [Sphingomonas sp. SRS2]